MIYYGVVEDRSTDPLKLGRCKVRIMGIHSEDNKALPTKDLPWAMVMQPTTSSANSGIGHSPTGIVEGTWVMVVFRDDFNQFPVIIGTLPGIPTSDKNVSNETSAKSTQPVQSGVVVSGDGSVVSDGSGQPVTSGNQEVAGKKEEPEKTPSANAAKRPSAMSTSENGFAAIRKKEGLASTLPNRRNRPKIGNDNTPGTATIYSYLDTASPPRWTIGWGNTYLEDMKTPVTESTTRTKAQCDELLKLRVQKDDEPAIRKFVKVPLTQSMFDACISLIYNMGRGNFAKSEFLKSLNAGKYEEAAALIPETNNNKGSLRGRRLLEKELFLKDGIPQDDGTLKDVPTETPKKTVDATQNPVVKKDERFVPASSDPGNVKQLNEQGFNDPTKTFPRFYDEPDTNRLARNENIDGTIVFKKECAVTKDVATADGRSWSQPPIPYNARYPYNRVYASESGHVQEFDDTPDNERIHIYHRAGTYSEVDVNGTKVNRIVGDSFQILERNGNVVIKGACNITIIGDGNIRVENNATIETLGNMDLKVGGNIGIGAGGSIRVAAGGEISLDGSAIHLNSGRSGSVKRASGTAGGAPTFPTLRTPTRFTDIDANYETPEEGVPPPEFERKKVEAGVSSPDEAPPVLEEKEKVEITEKKDDTGLTTSCDLIMKESSFTMAYRLTENFALKDVLKGSKPEVPSGSCYGVSANQIVCNLKHLTLNVLEPIKKKYPNMIITNTWRSEKRNQEVKGSKTSKHMTGEAVDLQMSGFSKKQLFDACVEISKLLKSYDKILLEYSGRTMWIHIQYLQKGNKNITGTIVVEPYKYHTGFKFFE